MSRSDGTSSRHHSSVSLRPADAAGPVNPALDAHTGALDRNGRPEPSSRQQGEWKQRTAADSLGAAAFVPGPSPAVAAAAAIGASVIESVSSGTMPIAVQTPGGGVSVVDVPVKIHTTKLYGDTDNTVTMEAVASVAADAMRETGAVFVQTTTGNKGSGRSSDSTYLPDHASSHHGTNSSADGTATAPRPDDVSVSRGCITGNQPRLNTDASAVAPAMPAFSVAMSSPMASSTGQSVHAVTPRDVGDALVRWATAHPEAAPAPAPVPAPQPGGSMVQGRTTPRMGPPTVRPPRASSVRSDGSRSVPGVPIRGPVAMSGRPPNGSSTRPVMPPASLPPGPPVSAASSSSSSSAAGGSQHPSGSNHPPGASDAMSRQLEFWKKTALELAWRITSEDEAAEQAAPSGGEAEATARRRAFEADMLKQARQASMGSATASRAALAAAVCASGPMLSSARSPAASRTADNAPARLTSWKEPRHVAQADVSSLHGSLPSLPSAAGDKPRFDA